MTTFAHLPRARHLRSVRRALLVGALVAAGAGVAADQASAAYSVQVSGGTLTLNGDGADDQLALRLQAGTPTTLQVDVGNDGSADFSVDRATFDRIAVNAGGGADTVLIDDANGVFTDTETTTVDGGAGNDTLLGGGGRETFLGGSGNDAIDGNQAADTALMGAGDDTFTWDPGDGSDVVEGQAGMDTMDFNGSSNAENFDLSANGQRLLFFRNLGNITMDMDDVELVDLDALGGADNVVQNDLTGTDAKRFRVNLLAAGAGDAQPDSITVKGTNGADRINVRTLADPATVSGLTSRVEVTGAEAANDQLSVDALGDTDEVTYDGTAGDDTIDVAPGATPGHVRVTGGAASTPLDVTAAETIALRGLAGADTISATGDLAPLAALRFDGGFGPDQLNGGNGADLMLGGPGNDAIDGNQGADTAFMGAGDDTFTWDPGDGSDTVEGQSGFDTMLFNGNAAVENFELSANGPRARFTRDLGNIVMDTNRVERVDLNALGGADNVVQNDMAGTDVKRFRVNLGVAGAGDGQPDTVTVNGTTGRDRINIRPVDGSVVVRGLASKVRISGSEAANDQLTVNTRGGNDRVRLGDGLSALIKVNVVA